MRTILLYGWLVLFIAIILNIAANYFKIATWYSYLQSISDTNFYQATSTLSLFEILFLYIIYPGLIGAVVFSLARFAR